MGRLKHSHKFLAIVYWILAYTLYNSIQFVAPPLMPRLSRPQPGWLVGYRERQIARLMTRAHSFPRAAEFQAKPWHLPFSTEF